MERAPAGHATHRAAGSVLCFRKEREFGKDLLPKTLADLINVRGAAYLASAEACKEIGIDIPCSQREVWLLKDEPSRGVTTG